MILTNFVPGIYVIIQPGSNNVLSHTKIARPLVQLLMMNVKQLHLEYATSKILISGCKKTHYSVIASAARQSHLVDYQIKQIASFFAMTEN
jgi:hypothetical protein